MSNDEDLIHYAQLVANAKLVGRFAKDYAREIRTLWEKGLPAGDKTGWPSVDRHYTVVPGQLTIITGWPSSGKSEWLDALAMNLAMQGWRFAVYSPENHPVELHISKYLEKHLGKPFGCGPTERINKDELEQSISDISEWFGFLTPAADTRRELFTPEHVLGGAEFHFRQIGYWGNPTAHKGLIIDPWNELEHTRPQHTSETEYISATLSLLRSWARNNHVHIWLVAHPQKLRREDGKLPIPRPDSISGSQHWWNKSDNAITIWRDMEGETPTSIVSIYVQKIRFKHVGRIGAVELDYDRVTGKYHEISKTPLYSVTG